MYGTARVWRQPQVVSGTNPPTRMYTVYNRR